MGARLHALGARRLCRHHHFRRRCHVVAEGLTRCNTFSSSHSTACLVRADPRTTALKKVIRDAKTCIHPTHLFGIASVGDLHPDVLLAPLSAANFDADLFSRLTLATVVGEHHCCSVVTVNTSN